MLLPLPFTWGPLARGRVATVARVSTPPSRLDGTHPRPQLVRRHHLALDRVVDFAHDDQGAGRREHWETSAAPWTRRIRLPFPPEAPASLIGDTGFHPVVWYRIAVTDEDLAAAGRDGDDLRVLLHFGAVDHEADVWVDGQHVAHHVGGQTAFSVDITDALAPGSQPHHVVVRAEDDPHDPAVPRGKQDWLESPHGIWYHRTTGIWRTVWLEAVPSLHLARMTWRADPRTAAATASVELSARPSAPVRVRVELQHEGRMLGDATVLADGRTAEVVVPIAGQRNGQAHEDLLWSPESPTLIDATVTLVDAAGARIDAAESYLGIRSVATRSGRFVLNGRPRVLRSVLEQGYWPDTHLAAPSSDALREEVALIRQLGFDSVRVHQKVEDPRFLYWADRLGLMVWGEIAAAYEFSGRAVELLTAEWVQTVRDRASHPSVVAWVPFNESWGVQHIDLEPAQRDFTIGLTALTRALDPTRPVISNDGWEHTASDILTIHDYEPDGDVLASRYGSAEAVGRLLGGDGPAGRRLLVTADHPVAGLPVMLTEFGGVRFAPDEAEAGGWGYSTAGSAAEYAERLQRLFAGVTASPVLAGFCYTQLTDTRQEQNGLCDERRVPKLPAASIAAMVRGEPA